MSGRLRIELAGEERWAELPDKGMLVLGADADKAGFVLDGQGVDAAHCAIGKLKDGGWAVKDLGSRFGTILNGKRIRSKRLEENDVIVLGSRRLKVTDPTAARADGPVIEEIPLEPVPLEAAPQVGNTPPAGSQRIGGYRLDKLLGRGGMGQVWLALQESLKRPVALKVLSPKLASDADFVRRFQSEARAAAALHHPNVVVIHDVGEADKQHFLSMEFMARGSLEDRVAAQGPLPWREVLDVLHDAGRGLLFAEAQGIVHRDIKPANLMIDGTGTIKIADLGLATATESEAEQEGGKKIYGTPHFIAPEQARGEPVDSRADLYSLGATAYRLLSGRTPFEGETTRDILRAHFTKEPEPLREVPKGLGDLVLRLLAKRPEDRFASAEGLVSELERLKLEADHGRQAGARQGGSKLVPAVVLLGLGLAAGGAFLFLGRGTEAENSDTAKAAAPELATTPADDAGFLAEAPDAKTAPDAEAELTILELEAELALNKIPAHLQGEPRIRELEGIAAHFDGTTAATNALAAIEELRTQLRREAALEARRAEALATIGDGLRTAANWPPQDDALPHPGHALRQLESFRPQDATLASDPAFAAEKRRLENEVVARSLSAFETEFARADRLANEGEFDSLANLLTTVLARCDLPEYPDGSAPERFDELHAFAQRIRTRKENLDSERSTYRLGLEAADRERLARTLGRGGAHLAKAFAFDVDGMRASANELATNLSTQDARKQVDILLEEARVAGLALKGLADELEADRWRRRTILDPTSRRATNYEVIETSADGLRVDIDGVPGDLPWSAFAESPEALQQLFNARLQRDYTLDERRGIVVLMRLAAARRIASIVSETIDPGRARMFQPKEARELRDMHDDAFGWSAGADFPAADLERLQSDRAAAELLAQGLTKAEEKVWSDAIASLETLFRDHPSSPVLLALSDGSSADEEE